MKTLVLTVIAVLFLVPVASSAQGPNRNVDCNQEEQQATTDQKSAAVQPRKSDGRQTVLRWVAPSKE
ncbi:hypothetical protein [Bradyrhizobium diazoefficiens]|uniref:hypothetical protein n=1 Tax=Bradyrhizobium diazoefficiens TaxID=1355477 RepID=UPI003515CBED